MVGSAAAAGEEQSPHVEYHFTLNELKNEGAASREQVAVAAQAQRMSSCGGVCAPGPLLSVSADFLCLNVYSSTLQQAHP